VKRAAGDLTVHRGWTREASDGYGMREGFGMRDYGVNGQGDDLDDFDNWRNKELGADV